MLIDFTPRLYQETIFNTASLKNTLVVLPTGLGKTAIALMLAEQRLSLYPKSKVVFFAPTKPLAEQHLATFQKHMTNKSMALFTGAVSPKKRKELFKQSQIIFSTPQGFENDILGSEITFEDVSLIVFDEAHRATGNYAYVFLAKQYEKQGKYARILALTASPGSELEKINEIIETLHIEEIEIRTEKDNDVKQYVQEVDINWIKAELPQEYVEIKKSLEVCFKSKLFEIKQKGYITKIDQMSKKDLIALQGALMGKVSKGEKDFDILKSVSLIAEALKVYHGLELIETQGVNPLIEYMEKLNTDSITSKTKATKNLVEDANFKTALIKARTAAEKNIEHPKLTKLRELITREVSQEKKIIVFSHYRDMAKDLLEELNKIKGVKAVLFVGQASKKNTKGLSQKEQKAIIEDFKAEKFNILVATSVAEEGLDIPQVDQVIFYEPVPSAIRHIQRRGRTGRQEKGQVIILMTKDTRDEHYRWSAFRKERKMKSYLEDLRTKIILTKNKQKEKKKDKTLLDYSYAESTSKDYEPKKELRAIPQQLEPPQQILSQQEIIPNQRAEPITQTIQAKQIKIFADQRERSSLILKNLMDMDVRLSIEQLSIGDFILSARVGVEYKKIPDFVDSIIDGRLLSQIKSLKQNFTRPLIIIEGEEDLFSQRNIHPNAINGMIATIAVSYGIPLIRTKNYFETANLLYIIARREQEESENNYTMHDKKPMTEKELQEYIISALPGIGGGLSKPLLKRFKSIKNVINADLDELKEVEKIGEKKAKAIKDIIEKEYLE